MKFCISQLLDVLALLICEPGSGICSKALDAIGFQLNPRKMPRGRRPENPEPANGLVETDNDKIVKSAHKRQGGLNHFATAGAWEMDAMDATVLAS